MNLVLLFTTLLHPTAYTQVQQAVWDVHDGGSRIATVIDAARALRVGNLVNLPMPEQAYHGTVLRKIEHGDRRLTISGEITDVTGGMFIVSFSADAMAAVITLDHDVVYRIRRTGDGRHVFQREDTAEAWPCLPPTPPPQLDPARQAAGGNTCDDGSVIDVLAVYDTSARDTYGGVAAMEAIVDVMVEYNNVSFINSGVNTTWNLVYTRLLPIDATGLSLAQLTDPADGVIDEVHALRDAYGADQVALLVPGFFGIANGLLDLEPESEELAFSISGLDAPTYVLSHEIGHNLGCCHAVGQGGGCPLEGGLLFDYSNGHAYTGDSGRFNGTVMAGGTFPHFSNPDVEFDGQPTGIPEGAGGHPGADNVRTINISDVTVANWRCNDGICEGLDLPSDSPDLDGNGIPDACDQALDEGIPAASRWSLVMLVGALLLARNRDRAARWTPLGRPARCRPTD